MSDIDKSDVVFKSLSCFKSMLKYDRVNPQIFLHNKSAYMLGEKTKGKIEFLNRSFETLVGIPFNKGFEYSENITNKILSENINIINKLARTYCETLFYIDKVKLIKFIDDNYNSLAKLNKMKLTITTVPHIRFNFKPIKKSTSVFESEYIISEPVRVSPNFRVKDEEIVLNSLLFYEVINNELFSQIIKMEINKEKKFIRLACVNDNVKVKFIINQR